MTPLSILDLSPIPAGSDAGTALRNSLDLARHAERLGYRRYWVAEHHNMPGIASAATAVVIAHIAAGTSTIRVGAGGIMLPNHSPLVVAEQFGTLESLHPGRIDLGLGRAPGTDMAATRALRRDPLAGGDRFPEDVAELRAYFLPPRDGQAVRAVPGAGLNVPIWLLGSSLFSARLAAALALPFAFASHFAPELMFEAIDIYRREFQPSASGLEKPYAMLGVNVFAADSDAEAHRLFTSIQQAFINLQRGRPGPLPPPVDSMAGLWSPTEEAALERRLACSVVGSRDTVKRGVEDLARLTGADEFIVTAQMFDHAARVHSFEILADAFLAPGRA
ncbi:MAG: LLM class flavin-dependent oxidoreductase [Vicinamibacterales bacterium]